MAAGLLVGARLGSTATKPLAAKRRPFDSRRAGGEQTSKDDPQPKHRVRSAAKGRGQGIVHSSNFYHKDTKGTKRNVRQQKRIGKHGG